MAEESYGAKDIQVLGNIEAVRKRPAMYIGSVGDMGLHHLVYEVVDNSVDEALAGFCTIIRVKILADGSVSVEDNGRGIPVEIHPKLGRPAMEIVLTKLHAGGKFDNKAYKVSGGLHGVGVSVTNALSARLIATVKRDGRVYAQTYEKGVPVTELETLGETDERGTTIQFYPDTEIFETTEFSFEMLSSRLREVAFLNPGLYISLTDERSGKQKEFKYDGGIVEFVKNLNIGLNSLHEIVYFKKERDSVQIEIAMQYNDGYAENVFSFANNINTVEGGTHLTGFRTALTRTLNNYAEKYTKDIKLTSEDVREGLSAVISVKLAQPQFEGQTKTKLGNSDIKGIVDSMVNEKLTQFLEQNPLIARQIIDKTINASKAREAARKARELTRRKGVLNGGRLPGKLADCASKEVAKCEIYIVEGDSAGGCLAGSTKVALVDGRHLTFFELCMEDKAGKTNYCYTIKNDGKIGIGKIINPRKTREQVEIIKLYLDNGEEIVCTPDHNFLLRDGSYLRADQLLNKGIMPLYRKLSRKEGRITIEGYEMVMEPACQRWVFTHMLSDLYNLENETYKMQQGSDKHHLDFNKLNNRPDNIVRMNREEHLKLHRLTVEKTLLREDVKMKATQSRRTETYRNKIRNMMRQPKMAELLSARAKKQWENQEYRKYMAEKFKLFYENNANYRQRSLRTLCSAQKSYWAMEENRKRQSERTTDYFENNAEARTRLQNAANKQWSDKNLRKWRSYKTQEQWTPEFRQQRLKKYNQTYLEHTLSFMKALLKETGNLDYYDQARRSSTSRNLLKKETMVNRFFDNDENALVEAVACYNHKVARVEKVHQKMDVYDLEVEGTHNFALAAGVFVHNSAKQGRNREFQAILPLRGKILNVEKARLAKVLSSNEIVTLISAIGAGIGEEFDIKKSRYGKIIIMTDADVDGAHIRTLLLTFFYRHMPKLIEEGHIYIAQPPLYRLKKGKQEYWLQSDEELERLQKELGGEEATVQRYKGLGEMNPQQLWETTMDPARRQLVQVTLKDAVEANQIFNILMGDDVEPRRIFILEHAKEVINLDI